MRTARPAGNGRVDVLVVGDANPDLVLRGDVVPRFGQAEQLLDTANLVMGGSATIAACGLARLGVTTAVAAVVGDDSFGRFTVGLLRDAGLDVSAIRLDPETPTGLSVILSTAGDRSILTLPGTIPLLTAAEVDAAIVRLRPRHVHIASYFLQPDLAAELPTVLARIRDSGASVSLDTNWDPAERWDGLVDVLPLVDVLLPNTEELVAIAAALPDLKAAPTGDPIADAAARICQLGPVVVVKAGKAGGRSFAPDGVASAAPGLALDVVDTTGAGDSFDAGYLAAVIADVTDEEERLRWAAVAGSLSTRAAGGTSAQATRAELDEHLSGTDARSFARQ
ncbi:sugar/nucleoside kinase (ribokinase family) [Mycetocola sp. CAN_C7]|uniref:carbohydrate kinase family protein n=1 Tax=Mycetocola sp. CAN_C7 TaxID=2787724 RepID=UPI0018CA72D6